MFILWCSCAFERVDGVVTATLCRLDGEDSRRRSTDMMESLINRNSEVAQVTNGLEQRTAFIRRTHFTSPAQFLFFFSVDWIFIFLQLAKEKKITEPRNPRNSADFSAAHLRCRPHIRRFLAGTGTLVCLYIYIHTGIYIYTHIMGGRRKKKGGWNTC